MAGKRATRGRTRPPGPGLAKARRGALVRVRRHEALTRDAEEALFAAPEVITEGSMRMGGEQDCWFGSTMITIDLARIAEHWRGPFDDEARRRLLEALEGSVRVRIRAMRLACADVARRLPDRSLGTAQVDTKVRIVGDKLHLDIDVEVPLDVSFAGRRR